MSETANKRAKYPEPSDNVDGFVDTKCKKKIKELLRYILTRFLSVSVNPVFKQYCQASEEAESDRTDGDVEFMTKYSDQLRAIFSSCGKHVALHHVDITKKLFFHILPNLGLPDGQMAGVKFDQIISRCIAEWFLSCFQVALVGLFPSEEVMQVIQKTTPNLSDVIRVTFWSKYLDSLLELKEQTEY